MAEDHPDGNHEDDVSAATSMSQTTHGAERKTGQPKIQLDWNQWLALRAGSFLSCQRASQASSRTDWSDRWRSGLHAGMHNDTWVKQARRARLFEVEEAAAPAPKGCGKATMLN